MKVIFTYIIVILLAVGLGYFLFTSSKKQSTNLPGVPVEILNQTHIDDGSTEHPAYNSNPPTSGWHWPSPAKCLAYDAQQPDERLIHNLEHGAVWISYKTSIDDQTKNQIKDFVRRYANVLTEPRDANDANIVLAAWGRLLKMDQYDENAIIGFINSFMDKGPEKVSCPR